jgi:hypothetical protein
MTITRRTILKGTLHGASIGVALPFLNMFLDNNGEALAATGQRIPVRFGTWIWGCGFIPERWIPQAQGANYVLPADLEMLAPYKDKLAIFSGFDVRLDGVPNKPHLTGCFGLRTGMPVAGDGAGLPTFDTIISDQIGAGTRFRSVEVSTSGIPRSYSFRGAGNPNPSETQATALYARLFGEGFQDPSAAKAFTPDPQAMVRKSVLSAVAEDRTRIMGIVGAEDRRRLDEYFTSIRQLEEQLALRLQPPAPVENFKMPAAPKPFTEDSVIDNVMATHKVMAGLLAVALQCDQTKVFNVLFSDTASNLRKAGSTTTHHTLTHNEPVNAKLGYQEEHAWFANKSMFAWKDFLDALAAIPEGKGTLLDNTVVLAHSDCSIANAHAVEGIPMMIAGNGGGRIRTGYHLAGRGDPNSRMGLTLQQAMGVQVEKWGSKSMETKRPITELLA